MKIEALDTAGYRKFGFIFAAIIALIFGLLFPWIFKLNTGIWPWAISAILFGWALLLPNTLSLIYKPWMVFGHYIGLVNTKIILVLTFFVLFFPIALILKLFGKDAMNRNFKDESISSCWKKSKKQLKDHMGKIY